MTTFEQRLKDSLSHAYNIERELGGGGMSRVFVATELSLGRKVVIKVLSPELTAEVNRGRFRREIQVAAQLQHPHIVTLLAAGEDRELVYYTMPFIVGESLKSALDKNGPLPIRDVVRVLYDVVDALSYAHGQGVVHRDIKPANILRSGAHALVTDFGVAKALNAAMPSTAMTSTGMAIGTPAYMAPEQLAGDPTSDHRIDIYAVGLLAYELLTGKSPFVANSPQGVLAAVLTRDPVTLVEVRPDVPRRLSEMVMACLSKVPGGRPPTADALMVALDMFSTASGEIRTREYRVPVIGPSVPVMVPPRITPQSTAPVTAATVPVPQAASVLSQPSVPASTQTSPDLMPTYDLPAKKSRRKYLIGGLAILLPAGVGALLLSQGESREDSIDTASSPIAMIGDSAVLQTAAPVLVTAVPGSAAPVDSAAILDSAAKRRAQIEAAKKRAQAAQTPQTTISADSSRQKEQSNSARAARAAAAMFENESARAAFARGATHTGGLLGTRRRGDLQTQIDALQPFLSQAGLTYEQFKAVVAEEGFQIFDEFGRMVPGTLQQFARDTVD